MRLRARGRQPRSSWPPADKVMAIATVAMVGWNSKGLGRSGLRKREKPGLPLPSPRSSASPPPSKGTSPCASAEAPRGTGTRWSLSPEAVPVQGKAVRETPDPGSR